MPLGNNPYEYKAPDFCEDYPSGNVVFYAIPVGDGNDEDLNGAPDLISALGGAPRGFYVGEAGYVRVRFWNEEEVAMATLAAREIKFSVGHHPLMLRTITGVGGSSDNTEAAEILVYR